MFKILKAFILIATLTAATEITATPRVNQPKVGNIPKDLWCITDFIIGLFMGSFGPISALSRDEDCFSVWYAWGVSTIEMSDFFSKKFNTRSASDWTKLFAKLILYGIKSYEVVEVCTSELSWNKKNPWHQNFGFLAKDIKVPHLPTMQDFEGII